MDELLGKYGIHKHSGFAGTVTAYCVYVDGYVSLEITPKTNNKNEYQSPQWFDRMSIGVKGLNG